MEFVKQAEDFQYEKLEIRCEKGSIVYKPRAFYASAYLGEESFYPSEWIEWCSTERFYNSGNLYIFDVDMSDIYIIDTVEDYKDAVTRFSYESGERCPVGFRNMDAERYIYFDPTKVFEAGWKGVYYTNNIARELHFPEKDVLTDCINGEVVEYSDLNALDTDQIIIFDPSCIYKESIRRLPFEWPVHSDESEYF